MTTSSTALPRQLYYRFMPEIITDLIISIASGALVQIANGMDQLLTKNKY